MGFQWKRLVSMILVMTLTFSFASVSVNASEAGAEGDEGTVKQADVDGNNLTDEQFVPDGDNNIEDTQSDVPETEGRENEMAENISSEDEKPMDGQPAMDNEEIADEADVQPVSEADKLSYVYIESPYIETPYQQNIVFSFEKDDPDIRTAILVVKNETTGETQEIEAEKIQDNLLLFSPVYESGEGVYRLTELNYSVGEELTARSMVLADQELGELTFGVNMELDVEYVGQDGQAVSEDAELEANIIELDEVGNPISGRNLQQEIENAGESLADAAVLYANEPRTVPKEYVVVLDPGHDSSHAGARGNGLKEEELTLKIANYCRDELETYAGVKVYMTRTSASCPNTGTSSTDDNRARVEYAASIGADLYVSIHLNSNPSASASGAEVYYPNSNYLSWVGTEGKALASKIQSELAALGLSDRGIKIRNSEDNTLYPDGSLADYYGVIKRSKELGFPGVIVEHAFLTNAGDVSEFLSSDAGLKKLGIADANGIAGYLGLSKDVNVTFDSLKIENLDGSQGTFDVVLSGVKPSNLIKKVQFSVWSDINGQDDLINKLIEADGSGLFRMKVDVKDHKYSEGVYFAQAFAIDIYGKTTYLGFAHCSVKLPQIGTVTVKAENNNDGNVYITTSGASAAKNVRFLVWSDVNGQDDMKFFAGSRNSYGEWTAAVPMKDFKDYGKYYVHVYVTDVKNTETVKTWTWFEINPPTAQGIDITYVDDKNGSFHAELKGLECSRGIKSVSFAVCSNRDTSNLAMYDASFQKNGTYAAAISISRHQYRYGTYDVHAYVTDTNGVTTYVKSTTAVLKAPNYSLTAKGNASQTEFTLTGENIYCGGPVKSVRFLVWGGENGQNDMKFYEAVKVEDGKWRSVVPILNHREAGTYYIHLYADMPDGSVKILRTGSFVVETAAAEKIDITYVNNDAGTFHAELKGITSKAGVREVKFAVCSSKDTSNIAYYNASLQKNGSYAAEINIVNHKMRYGTYDIHAYVTDNNGIMTYVKSTTANLTYTNRSTVKAIESSDHKWFAVLGENVYYAGEAKNVKFLVWGGENGQNDMRFYDATKLDSGKWCASVVLSNHKEVGTYYIHMYVTLKDGSVQIMRTGKFEVKSPSAEQIKGAYIDGKNGTFHAQIWGLRVPAGINKVTIAVCSRGDTSNIASYTAALQKNGCYATVVDLKNHQYRSGEYDIHAYVLDGNDTLTHVGMGRVSISFSGTIPTGNNYTIMGNSTVSVAQMVKYYNRNAEYPEFYSNTEASTIEKFCQIYYEECAAEGVRVEVAFCQAMKETGWLKFGGDVSIEQYNFAGIGATGNGAKGNSFASPRIGIRAQVQHLKAYATDQALNQECVDPRYQYVSKGCAPYVEWLGICENPSGKGWATGAGYGTDIVRRISVLKTY